MHTFDIVQTVAFAASFIALASRLLVASRAFWSRFPAWVQTFLPVLLPAFTAAAQGLTGVKSWSDLSVLFLVCAGMLLPGLPSNRSAAPLQAGKLPTLTPSAGDVAVSAQVVKLASIAPPKNDDGPSDPPWSGPSSLPVVGFLLFAAFAVHVSACSVFGSGGSFWPKVEHCAPSPASLVSQVADILLAGGDYEKNLESIALRDGAAVVECAVRAAVDSLAGKMGSSPENGSGVARGKAFLAKHPVGE